MLFRGDRTPAAFGPSDWYHDAMHVYEIQTAFGLDHLQRVERPDPRPGPGQVLIGMRAVSLNYRDVLTVAGHYNPKQPLPLIPCSDGVGVVREVGPGVTGLAVGDRVATLFAQSWPSGAPTRDKLRGTLGGPLDGTLAEQMVLPASGVIPVPAFWTDAEAATLPCAALTAWSALVTQGNVGPGDTVLVQGTGGVSIFALQIARLLGARVIVTSSSDAKIERAIALGAQAGINYRDVPEWGTAARALTDGEGIDHIVEVGGAGTLQQSLRAIRVGGTISVIGVLSGTASELNIIPVLMQNVRLQGILVGHRDGFAAMIRAFDQHQLRPVVDQTFAFEDTIDAFRHMMAGAHFGKVCIAIEP